MNRLNLLLAFILTGCGSLNQQFVKQERDYFDAVQTYHAQNETDHPDTAARLQRIDRNHDGLIQAAERSVGAATTQPTQ